MLASCWTSLMPLLAKLPAYLYSDLGKTRFTKIESEIELVGSVDILTACLLELLCSNSDFRIEFSLNRTEKYVFILCAVLSLVPLSTELYLDDLNARYTAVKLSINIVRIFKTMITKNAFPANVIPLDKPLKLGNSTITFFEEYVEKVVLDSRLYGFYDRVDTLKRIYELAKGHHGLVQVVEGPIFGAGWPGEYIIKLKTRGLERPPKDEQTTRMMTCNLLTGLKRLHQCGYVHRDIRLSNIVYDSNNPKGYENVLIDSSMENNTYTTLSDIYQLGKLLEGLNTVFSNDGQDFISKLKKKMLEADAALKHPWIA
ncbi:hypothetical protein G9A89_014174 [Geosiphon pyriformis]|nr:hypothetical protein G9A89_014174 [Geosiphon pyriformis]